MQWSPFGGFAKLPPGKKHKELNEKRRAGPVPPRMWIPELGSPKIWADFTWTTGTEPRDSRESRYA
jgi:hypothetical protein